MKFYLLMILFFNTNIANSQQIQFEEEIQYKKNNEIKYSELKSNEKLKLEPGDAVIAYGQNGFPFIILNSQDEDKEIKILKNDLFKIAIEQITPTLNKNMNEVIDGLRKVDELILKRDYKQALQNISSLKQKYESISSVYFASGTVNYLMNDKSAAIQDLEKGLKINTEDKSALALLEKLKKDPR